MKPIILVLGLVSIAFTQLAAAQQPAGKSVQNLVVDYLNVKTALTKDNSDSAGVFAKIFSADLREVNANIFTPSQREIWMRHYAILLKHSDHISSSTEIKHQRKHFAEWSVQLFQMLGEMKTNTVDLFYQYCPMADAYWISESSKIANPYYGKQMPTCGSTKDELKAVSQ